MDHIDKKLLELLALDARQSVAQLAREIGMSSPSVNERIKRLEEVGIIKGYRLEIDPMALGYGLGAMVRIRPLPGKLKPLEALLRDIPEVVECDKVTGDDCFIARLLLKDITDLDRVLERITDIAETSTAIVKDTTVIRRLPPLLPGLRAPFSA